MKRILFFSIIFLSTALYGYDAHYKRVEQKVEQRDTAKVLCIGNSFTYYWDSFEMLTEIAQSQGHTLNVKAVFVGGHTFARHLADIKTIKAIEVFNNAPYQVVILQNQSQLPAFYGRNPRQHAPALEDAKNLCARIREYSPAARLVLEATWAYPVGNYGGFSSYEAFDAYMWKGTVAMAKKCRCEVSPIGKAFALVRNRYPEIHLLSKDDKHQSMEGSYLKSCVNYLLLFGGMFDDKVSDCSLDKDVAAKLRAAAQEVMKR